VASWASSLLVFAQKKKSSRRKQQPVPAWQTTIIIKEVLL